MNSRIAFPFLVLPDDSVRFDGWLIGDPGQPLQPAGELLENWDYARDLEVAATLTIDWQLAAAALQIPADRLRLSLSLVAGTGTGHLPRRQDCLAEKVIDESSGETHLTGTLVGQRLSGRLRLSLIVRLDAPCGAGTELSPEDRGARLWQTHNDILLEDGGDSRFPVETASFSQIFRGKPQERAPWYLHWRPGAFQADFSGGIRLYLNTARPEVLARFAAGDEPTLQAIMGDVMSQMVESLLQQADAEEILLDCDEGSVAGQIQRWLDLGFPGQEIGSIKALRDQSPGIFRAALLAASEMEGAG